MAEGNRVVTVGVDTHKDAHVAAALDASGALLGTASFPADARGYASMVAWMRAFGRAARRRSRAAPRWAPSARSRRPTPAR